MNPIPKVAVVEDHSFYRNGLCMALKRFKFIELAFEATNGLEFIQKQRSKPVDIVLMDVIMPVLDGYRTVEECRKEFPGLKIIILTMLEEDENIQFFFDANVDAYLLKNIDNKTLELALKAVINGRQYFSEELINYFTRKLKEKREMPKNDQKLTSRELEVLQLIFEGYSNKEIADKLFISLRTVTNHRYNLKIKTAVRNTAGLISFGLRNKLLK